MEEPVDALAKLKTAVDKAKRSSSGEYPVAFVRTGDGEPLLSQLMRGGRGGEVRLRLYLTLRMQATRHPYKLPQKTARGLAALLNLPGDTGPRQINAALKWLETNGLIRRDQAPGKPAQITLLRPDGSETEWAAKYDRRYVTLPIELWTKGWILKLNGRSLAVYMALRELTGGKGQKGEVMDAHRKAQYGMSNDTWTRATKELETFGLLAMEPEVFGDDDLRRRVRKRYILTDPADIGSPSW